jgi:hypothetical protein
MRILEINKLAPGSVMTSAPFDTLHYSGCEGQHRRRVSNQLYSPNFIPNNAPKKAITAMNPKTTW